MMSGEEVASVMDAKGVDGELPLDASSSSVHELDSPQTIEEAMLLVAKEKQLTRASQKDVAKLVKRIKLDRNTFAQKMNEQKVLVDTLKAEHAQALETSRRYQAAVESMQHAHGNHTALMQENESLKATIERGNAELNELQATAAQQRAMLSELEQTVSELRGEVSAAKDQTGSVDARASELDALLAEREESIVKLNASLDELRGNSASYVRTIDEKTKRCSDLESLHVKLQSDVERLAAKVREAEEDTKEKDLQLAALSEGVARAQALVLERDEDLRKEAAARNALEDELQDWKLKASKADGEQGAVAENLQLELEAEKKKTSALLGKFRTLVDRYKNLQNKMAELEAQSGNSTELQDAHERIQMLQHTVTEVTEERRKLRLNIMSQVADFQKSENALQKTTEECSRLGNALTETQSALEVAKKQVADMAATRAQELEENMNRLREEFSDSLEKTKQQVERAHAEVHAKEAEVAELTILLEQSENNARTALREQQQVYQTRQEEQTAEFDAQHEALKTSHSAALSALQGAAEEAASNAKVKLELAVKEHQQNITAIRADHERALQEMQMQLHDVRNETSESAAGAIKAMKEENDLLRRKLMKLASQYKLVKSSENQEKAKSSQLAEENDASLQKKVQELDEAKAELDAVRVALAAKEHEFTALKVEHANENQLFKETLDKQSADITALQDQIKELEMADESSLTLEPDTPTHEDKQHAEQEMHELKQTNSLLQVRLTEKETEMVALKDALENERVQLATQLQQMRSECVGRVEEKEAELARLREDFAESSASNAEQIEDLTTQLETRAIELSKAATQLADAELRTITLEQDLHEERERVKELRQRGEQESGEHSSNLKNALEEAQSALAVARGEIEVLRGQLAETTAALTHARDKSLEKLEAMRTELERAVVTSETAVAARVEREQEVAALKEAVREANEAVVNSQARNEATQHEDIAQVEGLTDQIRELEARTEDLSRENLRLAQQCSANEAAKAETRAALVKEHQDNLAALRAEHEKALSAQQAEASAAAQSAVASETASKLHALCNRSMKALAVSLADIKSLQGGLTARDGFIAKQKTQIEGLQAEKKKREKEEAERKEREKEEEEERERQEELKRNSGVWKYVNKLRPKPKKGPVKAILTDNKFGYDPVTGTYTFEGQDEDESKSDGPGAMPSMLFMASKAPGFVQLPSVGVTGGRGLPAVLKGLAAQLKNVDKLPAPKPLEAKESTAVQQQQQHNSEHLQQKPDQSSQEPKNEADGDEEEEEKTEKLPRRRGWAAKAGRTRSRLRDKRKAAKAANAPATSVSSPFASAAPAMPPPSGGSGNLFSRGSGLASRYTQGMASIEGSSAADSTSMSMLMPAPLGQPTQPQIHGGQATSSSSSTAAASASVAAATNEFLDGDGDFDLASFDFGDDVIATTSSDVHGAASSQELALAKARIQELTTQLEHVRAPSSSGISVATGSMAQWEAKYNDLLAQFQAACAERDQLQEQGLGAHVDPILQQPISSDTSKFWPLAPGQQRSVDFALSLSKCYAVSVVGAFATVLGTAIVIQ